MIIVEAVNFFVEVMEMSWWALGRIYIPETNVNGQFIFIFTLLLTLGWKILLQKTLPPLKVDNIEFPNSNTNEKNKENYNKFSKKRKASTKDVYW